MLALRATRGVKEGGHATAKDGHAIMRVPAQGIHTHAVQQHDRAFCSVRLISDTRFDCTPPARCRAGTGHMADLQTTHVARFSLIDLLDLAIQGIRVCRTLEVLEVDLRGH